MSSDSASTNSEISSNTENFIAPAMVNIENLCKLMSLELVNMLAKQYNFDAGDACEFLGIELLAENIVVVEESDSEHSVKDNDDESVSGLTNSIGQLSVSDAKVDRKKKAPKAESEEKKPSKARTSAKKTTSDDASASTENTEEKKKPAKARASAKKTKTEDDSTPTESTEAIEEKKKPAKARASAKKTKTEDDSTPSESTEATKEKKKPAKARATAKKTKTDDDVAATTEETEEKKKPAKKSKTDDADETSQQNDGEN
jgi:hypothetical protein